jgi:hypothetical protein
MRDGVNPQAEIRAALFARVAQALAGGHRHDF